MKYVNVCTCIRTQCACAIKIKYDSMSPHLHFFTNSFAFIMIVYLPCMEYHLDT